jgi:creatinine amidohydrolase/Fe(II)-dependent formamide hydrolase-like protein
MLGKMIETIKLEELTSPDIEAAMEAGYSTVVFAVGSTEQHGPCLPLATDAILGDALALAIAEKLEKALRGPTIRLGCSDHHMRFPGTISMKKETLQSVVKDYVDSLVRHGFKRIVIIPSHGGNFGPLAEIADDLQRPYPEVKIITYTDLQGFLKVLMETSARLGVTPEESGAHAGESEVSMMMWTRGDLVKEDLIPEGTGYLGEFAEEETDKVFEEGIGALSPIGVLGSPTKAKKEHGKAYIEELASALVDYINSR